MKKYRWGIIGTGMIAHEMADALSVIENAEIGAVLSRKQETARKFADEYSIPNLFTDLKEFSESDCFDIAYVASPHNGHKSETIACLENGKSVLCEKPMGVNFQEVSEMISAAKSSNQLLVEAFWTFYFPAMQKALSLIQDGAIGKPVMVDARFCFYKAFDPLDRKFNPDLAGGALLDIGLYCIAFAQKVFEEYPQEIKGMILPGKTGTDDTSAYLLRYSGNRLATLTSSFSAPSPNDGWIFGEKGSLQIPLFWQPDNVVLHKDGNKNNFNFERFGNGYPYEAVEMMKYLEEGKKESDVFSLKKSKELIQILDKIRNDWGLKYPFE